MRQKILALLLALLLTFASVLAEVIVEENYALTDETAVEYGMDYYGRDEIALYLHAFAELPPNYLTKDEAADIGRDKSPGQLWDEIGYGLCIGGDTFGNREGLLPEEDGRTWYECDVNYDGYKRGSERIVFSTEGLIYYTGDHYESFVLLYEGWFYADAVYGEEEYGGNYYDYGDYDYSYDEYDYDNWYEEVWP